MRTKILGLAALTVAVVPAFALGAHAKMSPVVSAKLTNTQEVPKVKDAASGVAVLHLDAKKGTACWSFKNVTGVKGPNAAHIHKGAKGKAGPVFIPLGAKYKATGCQKATKAQIEAVESNPNGYYVNIHNKEYGDGAIRGQLAAGMVK